MIKRKSIRKVGVIKCFCVKNFLTIINMVANFFLSNH